MGNRPALTVVVPTRDRVDMLTGCLESLRKSLGPGDEMLVADSASIDPRVREVAEAYDATYVRCDQPGASRARNAGWQQARHDYVAFIDDDVRVEAGWADALAATFEEFPDAAFLTGSVGYPPGPRPKYPVPEMLTADAFDIDEDSTLDPGHSANFAARRTALEEVGGFDELLGAGAKYPAAEDKDLIDRLIASGLPGRYEPTIAAIHLTWRADKDVIRQHWQYGLGTGVRIVKIAKTNRARLADSAKAVFWTWGLWEIFQAVRHRQRLHTKVAIARTTAMFLGAIWALPARVKEGHFVPRGPART